MHYEKAQSFSQAEVHPQRADKLLLLSGKYRVS